MSDFIIHHSLLREKLGSSGLRSKLTYNSDKPWEFLKRLFKALLKGSDVQEELTVDALESLGYRHPQLLGLIDANKPAPIDWVSTDEELERVLLSNATLKQLVGEVQVFKADYVNGRSYEVYLFASPNVAVSKMGLSLYSSRVDRTFDGSDNKRFTFVNSSLLAKAVQFADLIPLETARVSTKEKRKKAEHTLRVQQELGNEALIQKAQKSVDKLQPEAVLCRFKYELVDYLISSNPASTVLKISSRQYILSFLSAYREEMNITSMEQYEKASSSDYARSWQTKKNIPQNYLQAMSSSSFLQNGFDYVEFDSDTDLGILPDVEKQWAYVFQSLPRPDIDRLELRFRKLGNHKAAGLWFPLAQCIAIDIRHPDSLIHEYGHFLDYHTLSDNLSLQPDFQGILFAYQDYIDDIKLPRADYYKMPTEVFAHSFEVYYGERMPHTTVSKSAQDLRLRDEYKGLYEKSLFEQVTTYFDNLFKNVYHMELKPSEGGLGISPVGQSTMLGRVSYSKEAYIRSWSRGLGIDLKGQVPAQLDKPTTWCSLLDAHGCYLYVVAQTDKETLNSKVSTIVLPFEQFTEEAFIQEMVKLMQSGSNALLDFGSVFGSTSTMALLDKPIGISSLRAYAEALLRSPKVDNPDWVSRITERLIKEMVVEELKQREVKDFISKVSQS